MLYAGLLFFFFNFMRVMVWAGFIATSYGDSFCTFHHEGAAKLAMVACRACFNCVLAFRIV